jgi:glucose-1-phosphate cytidylyltransferase
VKVVILCGGLGTRLREETEFRPKPMVPIGTRPILWHVMRTYAACGFTDFVLALGYRGEMIKDYFVNYDLLNSDFTLDLGSKSIERHNVMHEESDWRITFVDTGQGTMTGGRLKRLQPYLRDEPRFMLAYGDGVTDLDVRQVLNFQQRTGLPAVVTGVHQQSRFGELAVSGDRVTQFAEKPGTVDSWINAGFFVLTPGVFDYIDGDDTVLERDPMERLAREGQLGVYKHDGFWQCMDNVRDMQVLNDLWNTGKAPWLPGQARGRRAA